MGKTPEKERPPLQLPLKAENLKNLWFFPDRTMIWPERGGRGVVQEGLYAEKVGRKVRGLSGFRALDDCVLYLDRRYWTLARDSFFGAYAKNGKRVKIK